MSLSRRLNFPPLNLSFSQEEFPEVAAVCRSRRHPVYVHCKMTLFDDDYVLVGSANVNQRSLGGNRDSEIAVGAFQPAHTAAEAEGGLPRGGVRTYRMALWAAHLAGADEAYADPSSDDCLAKVREVTEAFWADYTAEEPKQCEAHMLPYPVTVDEEGHVSALESPFDRFPDTQASVLGKRSGYLPSKLTT